MRPRCSCSASSTPAASCMPGRRRRSSAAPRSRGQSCGASPAIRGTPRTRPAGQAAGRGPRSRPGTTTLATGSDIGGSIRIPASFCGVVGFKPPYGRVPEVEVFNLDHYCHEGPLARTVADCALLENVIAGPHPATSPRCGPSWRSRPTLEPVTGMRVALCPDLGCYQVDADVAANTRPPRTGCAMPARS